jgi:adenylate kinase
MSESRQRIVLLGPPASGKGTQGRRLAKALGLGYLSTGSLLRENVAGKTPLGIKAEPILARGEYLPDELMEPILEDWLVKQDDRGWVLDGFPRSKPQAVWLDSWLAGRGTPLDAAICLEVPYEELLTRVLDRVECPSCRWSGNTVDLGGDESCPKCGNPAGKRSDDTAENLKRRHQEFTTITGPAIQWYHENGTLHCVDATAPSDEVAANLLNKIQQG